jgi:hypothetical protein
MSNRGGKRRDASAKDAAGAGRAGREERLAAALRDNLRRRKAQARERRGAEAGSANPAAQDRDDG